MPNLTDSQGNAIPFTARNGRFWTDISKGKKHGNAEASGSVFAEPLVQNEEDGQTLWLEYVHDNKNPENETFWLMWYNVNGTPKIPMSGVFDREQYKKMVGQLTSFLPT